MEKNEKKIRFVNISEYHHRTMGLLRLKNSSMNKTHGMFSLIRQILHVKVCGPIVAVLFFSLDRPVTKNQILNTKCQPRFLALSQFQKRRTAWPLLFFRFEMTTKNFNWHLFLVTGWSSEKNILCMYYCYAATFHALEHIVLTATRQHHFSWWQKWNGSFYLDNRPNVCQRHPPPSFSLILSRPFLIPWL